MGGEAGYDGGQGLDVEMVAGLVEDQQLRRSRGAEDAGEAGADHLAAAQCPGDPVGGVGAEAEERERGAALVVRRPGIAVEKIVGDRALGYSSEGSRVGKDCISKCKSRRTRSQ